MCRTLNACIQCDKIEAEKKKGGICYECVNCEMQRLQRANG